jgi:hypothetical protein
VCDVERAVSTVAFEHGQSQRGIEVVNHEDVDAFRELRGDPLATIEETCEGLSPGEMLLRLISDLFGVLRLKVRPEAKTDRIDRASLEVVDVQLVRFVVDDKRDVPEGRAGPIGDAVLVPAVNFDRVSGEQRVLQTTDLVFDLACEAHGNVLDLAIVAAVDAACSEPDETGRLGTRCLALDCSVAAAR